MRPLVPTLVTVRARGPSAGASLVTGLVVGVALAASALALVPLPVPVEHGGIRGSAAHVEVPNTDGLGAADATETVEDREVSERDGAADAVRDGGGVGDAEGVAQRRDARRRVGVERAVEDVPESVRGGPVFAPQRIARRIARRIRIARRTPSSPPTRRAW